MEEKTASGNPIGEISGLMIKSSVRALAAGLCAIACAGVVAARSIDGMNAAFTAGDFVEVAEMADAVGTAEAYALAANSLSIYGHYVAEGDARLPLFERAMQLARKAVELDAGDPLAYFQLAHSMGRYSQQIGVGKALKGGYAEKVRDALDTALKLDPDFAPTHVSYATWHMELVQKGGFVAALAYGASRKKGIAHFERALALDPQLKVALHNYAVALLRINKTGNRDKAINLLARNIKIKPKNAFEKIIHQESVNQLAALEN